MRFPVLSLVLIALPGILQGQAASPVSTDIKGHYVGEPVARFLRLEADARQDVDVCRQNAVRSSCQGLLAAVDSGARFEISTTMPVDMDNPDRPIVSLDFIIEGGKVVKVTLPVDDLAEFEKKLGAPTRETAIPSQNSAGVKWQNHLSVWESPGVYISLYDDNNPALEDHRPLLVMESTEEHAKDDASAAVPAQNTPSQ